jgi:hypothetical protein
MRRAGRLHTARSVCMDEFIIATDLAEGAQPVLFNGQTE